MKVTKKLSLREDWAVVPGLAMIIGGTIVSVYDFIVLQSRSFQWTTLTVAGVLLIVSP